VVNYLAPRGTLVPGTERVGGALEYGHGARGLDPPLCQSTALSTARAGHGCSPCRRSTTHDRRPGGPGRRGRAPLATAGQEAALRNLAHEGGDIEAQEPPLDGSCRLRVVGYRVVAYRERGTIECVFADLLRGPP